MERVGRVGDGGTWTCGLEALRQRRAQRQRPCVVYAFGVNDDTSFEEELVNRTGCQVFAFDPTVFRRVEPTNFDETRPGNVGRNAFRVDARQFDRISLLAHARSAVRMEAARSKGLVA